MERFSNHQLLELSLYLKTFKSHILCSKYLNPTTQPPAFLLSWQWQWNCLIAYLNFRTFQTAFKYHAMILYCRHHTIMLFSTKPWAEVILFLTLILPGKNVWEPIFIWKHDLARSPLQETKNWNIHMSTNMQIMYVNVSVYEA